MKIVDVKKLDDGVSNITIEGRITRVLKPRETQYGWSQFIVIKDDTDNMGSNVNLENEEAKYQGGEYVKIKGKVSRYISNNKPGISLNGNVIDEIVKVGEDVAPAKQTKEETEKSEKSEKVDPGVWEAKDLRMARESALKNIALYVVAGLVKLEDRFDYAQEDVDFIYKEQTNIVEESIKEFGGTVEEEKPEERFDSLGNNVVTQKEKDIARARELVKNPYLAEPVNNTMATVKQKKQIYGYIDEEGKKLGGIVDSQYLTKEEAEGIGKPEDLTKSRAFAMWEKWYGKEGELGERDRREMTANEKKQKDNPFVTKREPVEKRDPKNKNSLAKDMVIEKIQDLRKKNHLLDDEKFSEALGCNAKFNLWTEKELGKLKEKLEIYRPAWLKE